MKSKDVPGPSSTKPKQKRSDVKTAVLTGGRGFIGSHLLVELRRRGFKVHSLVRTDARDIRDYEIPIDLNSQSAVEHLIEKLAPHHVFHLAGTTSPGRRLDRFTDLFESDVRPTINLALALGPSVEMFYVFGSCEEYGAQEGPFHEDQGLDAVSDYGWTKISIHHSVRLICRQNNIPFCYLRPFLTFGPGQHSALLVPHLINACLTGRHASLTSGEQSRDFLYVHDLVGMLGKIIDNPAPARAQTLNLCTGEPVRVRLIGEEIHALCGKGSLGWGELPNRSNESSRFFGDPSKFRSLYGEYPLTPRKKALAETVAFERERLS